MGYGMSALAGSIIAVLSYGLLSICVRSVRDGEMPLEGLLGRLIGPIMRRESPVLFWLVVAPFMALSLIGLGLGTFLVLRYVWLEFA